MAKSINAPGPGHVRLALASYSSGSKETLPPLVLDCTGSRPSGAQEKASKANQQFLTGSAARWTLARVKRGWYLQFSPTKKPSGLNLGAGYTASTDDEHLVYLSSAGELFVTLNDGSAPPPLAESLMLAGAVVMGKGVLRHVETFMLDDRGMPLDTVMLTSGGDTESATSDDQYLLHHQLRYTSTYALRELDLIINVKDEAGKDFSAGNYEMARLRYEFMVMSLAAFDTSMLTDEQAAGVDLLLLTGHLNLALVYVKLNKAYDTVVHASLVLNMADDFDQVHANTYTVGSKLRAKAWYRRARAYLMINREKLAIKDLKDALHACPSDDVIEGMLHEAEEKWVHRRSKMERALKLLC